MHVQTYWSPVREIERIQEELNNLFSGVSGAVHEYPAVNVWGNDNEAFVAAELPGIDPARLEVTVENDTLFLHGVRNFEEPKEATWHRRERIAGEFTRTLQLPFRVSADKISAKYTNGILTVALPRAEEDKPRKISISAE